MKWTYRMFCIIWLITSCIFGILAYESYQSINTELAQFSTDIPTNPSLKIAGTDLGRVINTLSEITNQNIIVLEDSIRHSAKLTFVLNIISCFMAFVGFVAQLFDHRDKNQGCRKQDASQE